jgi:putative ABC transport system permease protein
MIAFAHQLKHAARRLRATPGVTITAVMALGLGIGLTTTMFSVVYGVLVRGLPYPNADRIAVVYRNNPSQGLRRQPIPARDFAHYRSDQKSFTALGTYTSGTAVVAWADEPGRADVGWVTANVFAILGVRPALGRTFSNAETTVGGAPAAIIGYRAWRERYAASPNVLGSTIKVGATTYTIVGVMPDNFAFPASEGLWLPLQIGTPHGPGALASYVVAIGLLAPDVSRAAAAADVSTIARRLAMDEPQTDKGFSATVGTFTDWSIGPGPKRLLQTMLGAVFCVLLVACANVMNLLSERAISRTRDIGIRTALGATRAAVLSEILIETSLLAFAGIVVGMLLSAAGVGGFNRAIVDSGFPAFVQVGLFAPVLAFAVAMGAVASLASGVVPALRASRVDVADVLKDGSRGGTGWRVGRLSKTLVVVEAAVSCLLLAAAGLMIRSVAQIRDLNPGFNSHDVFTAALDLSAAADSSTLASQTRQIEERLAAIPGAASVSLSSGLPGATTGLADAYFARPAQSATNLPGPVAAVGAVSPGFFATLGIPLETGRQFNPGDRAGTPAVAVVTKQFVRTFFAGRDPLGQRVRIRERVSDTTASPAWITIVGVVPDVWGGDPENPHPAILFRPLAQASSRQLAIAVRTTADPLSLTRSVRDALHAVSDDVVLYSPMTLAESIAQPLWFVRLFGTMFMIFGAVAVFLGMVGLYAVTAFATARRMREMSIRIALGARRVTIARLVLGQSTTQLGLGLLVGLAMAALALPLLGALLVGVDPRDPLVFGGVTAALLATGTLACLRPALSASRADLMTVLRQD